MKSLPDVYKVATLSNVTAVDQFDNRIGVGLLMPNGNIERFSLSIESAKTLSEEISYYLSKSQSLISSGIDNKLGLPQDGQKVKPLDIS